MAGLPKLTEQYRQLRVNQVRTHDFMGPTEVDSKYDQNNSFLAWLIPDSAQRASVVKAGNASIIFPDWSADPEKPASYNFAPTDKVIAGIRASGAQVYYRIGRSFGANVNPPADFDKFASVLKHIAMHYNQGWDNGFHYGIMYWEFWNEPEIFWSPFIWPTLSFPVRSNLSWFSANSRFHYPLPATTKVSKSIFGLAFHVRRNGEQASGQPIAAWSVR